jgi:hypothetical protein
MPREPVHTEHVSDAKSVSLPPGTFSGGSERERVERIVKLAADKTGQTDARAWMLQDPSFFWHKRAKTLIEQSRSRVAELGYSEAQADQGVAAKMALDYLSAAVKYKPKGRQR